MASLLGLLLLHVLLQCLLHVLLVHILQPQIFLGLLHVLLILLPQIFLGLLHVLLILLPQIYLARFSACFSLTGSALPGSVCEPASRPRRNLALTKGPRTFLPSSRDYLRPRHFLAPPLMGLGSLHTAELREVLSVSGYHARTQLPFDGKTSQYFSSAYYVAT